MPTDPDMKPFRCLVVSNARPSRTWRIANRIASEVPNGQVCGIVQQSLRHLPAEQQLVGEVAVRSLLRRLLAPLDWFRYSSKILLNWMLWCVHGCPGGLGRTRPTVRRLSDQCDDIGWPFFLASNAASPNVLSFVRQQAPDLIIVIGRSKSCLELSEAATYGCIHTWDEGQGTGNIELRVEHFAKGTVDPFPIASLKIPVQPYDGMLGLTLKNDLIADDLLTQTAIGLKAGTAVGAAREVNEWAHKMFASYLTQPADLPRGARQGPLVQRHRSISKLCLDTLLLCSPWMIGRNLYRRWRGRYPILILAHHLISDRPHRMGVSTETFLRQVHFLQRHYRIVSLSEAVGLLRSGVVRVPTVVLTFDDGYVDNFVTLRAVAEEAEVPVALFLSVEPVETNKEFQHDLHQGIKGALPLTWDQIRYWGLRGAEFGSHTRTHFDCGATDPSRLRSEIVGSRVDIEVRTGKPVPYFAFPFGKYENISLHALKMAGDTYSYFASSFGGENHANQTTTQQHLFRKNLYTSLWELELELQSVFDWVDAFKRLFRSSPRPVPRGPGGVCGMVDGSSTEVVMPLLP